MAKIFKFSGYYITSNDEDYYSKENVKDGLMEFYDMIPQHVHVEEADIGRWNSESPLNHENCDLAECEKFFINEAPVINGRKAKPGQIYKHFKGKTVKVLHIGQDTENPGNFFVVYECPNGVWCRPYGMFLSEVDHEKYPDVKQKYRFELVAETRGE